MSQPNQTVDGNLVIQRFSTELAEETRKRIMAEAMIEQLHAQIGSLQEHIGQLNAQMDAAQQAALPATDPEPFAGDAAPLLPAQADED